MFAFPDTKYSLLEYFKLYTYYITNTFNVSEVILLIS